MTYMNDTFSVDGLYRQLLACKLSILDAAACAPPPLEFVVPGLLRGSVGIVVAPGGVGKSTLWLQTAISVAYGRDLYRLWSEPGAEAKIAQGPVVIVAAEDPKVSLQERIHRIGKGLPDEVIEAAEDNIALFSTIGCGFSILEQTRDGWAEAKWMTAVHDYIEQMQVKPRLVVFDTLNRCLGGANENGAGDMGRVVSILEKLGNRYDCAVLVLHHPNRASSTGEAALAATSSRGSSALPSNARFMMTMAKMTKKEARELGYLDVPGQTLVNLAFPKTSYSASIASRWVLQDEDGVFRGLALPDEQQLQTVQDLVLPFDGNDEEDWA